MSFVPTPSQQQAIITIDRHVAVTAGAGSGKTRVLVERYLNLVEQGVLVGKIAAITFTKKAAQEMKDRLRLSRPDLTESLEQAQISTIHSLCQRIIREHPLQAAIDPLFRVGEEWETRALLIQTVEEAVELEELPEELGTPSEVAELVLELYTKMLTKGDLRFNRLDTITEKTDFLVAPLCRAVDEFLLKTPSTEIQRKVMHELQGEWATLQDLLRFPDDGLRLEALDVLLNLVKRIRGKMSEHTAEIKDLISLGKSNIYNKQGAEIIDWVSGVLQIVHTTYKEKKKSLGIVDYNDLEHLAYYLLQNPEVRAHYAFTHLMVDEFQDTNPLQKKIVDCLVAQGALLFVVGDPKQSIYRFRGADVGVFVETKEEIEQTGKNIFLAENFRSRPELIEFTNFFFEQLMEGESISFEASVSGKNQQGRACVSILRTPASELTLTDARVLEAEQIALKINKLVDQGSYNYKDISLLFRAMTNVQIYEKALQEAGIPYVNLSAQGFYSKQEIQDVLHYFRWLEDEKDMVARLAVLRSPFYLISDQGLFWLRQNQPEKLSAREQESLQRSQTDYVYLVQLALQKSAPEVITAMLERTDYAKKTWRLPFGQQKIANIEKLSELSWDLFSRDFISVPEQLRYINLMAQDSKGEGEALLEAEHADVVVLRTIHGAKGLEFPVVFLPDTNGRLTRTQSSPILYHPEFGLCYQNMDSYRALKEQEQLEELSEAKRLLYVALTRAEEDLFWCVLDGPKEQISWWSWLQVILPDLPKHLYQEIAGDLQGLEGKPETSEVLQLKSTHYEPLPAQYRQVSFSVTSLMNYARCPRYYYLRYILGVPERANSFSDSQEPRSNGSLSALQRGNIVHRVCEQIDDANKLGKLVKYAAELEGIRLDSTQQIQLEKIIMPYLESEFFRRLQEEQASWEIYREKEFNLPVGDFLVNGLVDQVFVGRTNIEVVDFKSNWINANQVKQVGNSYTVQLQLYAWAMGLEFGLPVLQSQAYFLIPNKLYSLDAHLLDSNKTEEWVMQTCRRIIASAELGLDAFPVLGDCLYCGQRSYCGNSALIGENTNDVVDWAEEELV